MYPGDVVSERFRVVERIGEGGMGSVFRVEQTLLGTTLAMKVLRPELSSLPDMEKRFEREAKAVARLDSPHIVRINDFGRTEDGQLFLIMELVEGETLMQRLKREGALQVDESIEIVDQLLAGLEHAHTTGVVHRDLKPGNIMLVPTGEELLVKILDFGLARRVELSEDYLTQAGLTIGTAKYMSPEQAQGAHVDHRSDLYSVGVILYLLLTGRHLFRGSESEVLRAHLTEPPPPLDLELGDTRRKEALAEVVRVALAKSPDDRFPDAAAFRAALAECAPGSDPSFLDRTSLSVPIPEDALAVPPELDRTALRVPNQAGDPATPPELDRTSIRAPQAARRHSPFLEIAASVLRRPRLLLLGSCALLLALIVRWTVVEASLSSSLNDARSAIAAGRTDDAARLLDRLSRKHGEEAEVDLLLGHLAVARRRWHDAVIHYESALEKDADIADDEMLRENTRRILGTDRDGGRQLVDVIARKGGDAAVPILAGVIRHSEDDQAKRAAYRGLERLDETDAVDEVAFLVDGLDGTRAGKCEVRKWYVTRLAAFDDDTRVLPALRREQNRKTGFLFFKRDANGCMQEELDALIEDLED